MITLQDIQAHNKPQMREPMLARVNAHGMPYYAIRYDPCDILIPLYDAAVAGKPARQTLLDHLDSTLRSPHCMAVLLRLLPSLCLRKFRRGDHRGLGTQYQHLSLRVRDGRRWWPGATLYGHVLFNQQWNGDQYLITVE